MRVSGCMQGNANVNPLPTLVTVVSYLFPLNEYTMLMTGFLIVLIGVWIVSCWLAAYIVLKMDLQDYWFLLIPWWDTCHIIGDNNSCHIVVDWHEHYCIHGNHGLLFGITAHLPAHLSQCLHLWRHNHLEGPHFWCLINTDHHYIYLFLTVPHGPKAYS